MTKRVRAIIIQDDSLLTIKRVKPQEIYWVFPGGKVEAGESDQEALVRECKEELGLDVQVEELLFEKIFDPAGREQQMEYFYRCSVVGGELGTGDGPEYAENNHYDGTHEAEWVKMKDLAKIDLKPKEIKEGILKL